MPTLERRGRGKIEEEHNAGFNLFGSVECGQEEKCQEIMWNRTVRGVIIKRTKAGGEQGKRTELYVSILGN